MPAVAVGEHGAGVLVDGHDRRIAKQAAELKAVADFLADGGGDAHGGGSCCLIMPMAHSSAMMPKMV